LPPRRRPIIAGAAAAAAAVLLSVVFYIATDHGRVKIELSDPTAHVEIKIDGKEIMLVGPDETYKLRSGPHELEVTGKNFRTVTKKFTVRRGETDVVTAELLPTAPPVAAVIGGSRSTDSPLPTQFKNSLGMEFVLVPKGKSWLGGDAGKLGDREVEIKEDFFLGKYEVTQEEWQKVTGKNPSRFSRGGSGAQAVQNISDAELGRFPVENVSWNDAQSFIKLLNEKTKEAGWMYRLPNEGEWEYACRGGPIDKSETAFDFYVGAATNQLLAADANFEGKKGLNRTCKVGSYLANRLGLHDMHGNVWEWCLDQIPAENRKNPPYRAYRGGGWEDTSPVYLAAARRHRDQPSTLFGSLGLRVARVPVGKEVVKVIPTPPPPVAAPAATADAVALIEKLGGKYRQDFSVEGKPLIEINLLSKPVHDDDLRAFAGQAHLQVLILGDTRISDAGLAHLKGLTSLNRLDLGTTDITNVGLVNLKDMTKLQRLELYRTTVGDAGLAHLSGLTDLRVLGLEGTRVGDAGMASLKSLARLEALNLGGTNVSDDGLEHLKGLKSLREFHTHGTRATEAGKKRLQDAWAAARAAATPSAQGGTGGGAVIGGGVGGRSVTGGGVGGAAKPAAGGDADTFVLRIQARNVDHHRLRISADGIETLSTRYTWPSFRVNDIDWSPETNPKLDNKALGFIPDWVDFSTAQIIGARIGQWGDFRPRFEDDHLDLFLIRPPRGATGYDFTIVFGRRPPQPVSREPVWNSAWKVNFYKWNAAEHGPLPDIAKVVQGAVLVERELERLNLYWWLNPVFRGVPLEWVALSAERSFTVPAGKYRVATVCDDGVRVLIDGKKVLENWTAHTSQFNTALVDLSAGEHTVRVEHFQGKTLATLAFWMRRAIADAPPPAADASSLEPAGESDDPNAAPIPVPDEAGGVYEGREPQ
jgi:formylglycine-generating enzyme required for sulfatase activity